MPAGPWCVRVGRSSRARKTGAYSRAQCSVLVFVFPSCKTPVIEKERKVEHIRRHEEQVMFAALEIIW